MDRVWLGFLKLKMGLQYGLLVFLILVLVACSSKKDTQTLPVVPVSVSKVVQQAVPITLTYVGTTESVLTVDIRARVEGFLQSQNFQDGADVKKGELLFVIDPRPFQAALDSAKAALAKAEANAEFYRAEVRRMSILVRQGAVSKEKYDLTIAQSKEADAQVAVDKANVKTAQLNLSYCWMYSPMDGRIGARDVDIGNLVGGSEKTKLATIVQLNPMYAYFSPSAKDLPDILNYMKQQPLKTLITLPGKTSSLNYQGVVDFVNNQVGSSTSTIQMRTTVNNPDKTLLPGLYVQLTLLLGENPNALLIPQTAVMEDQNNLYVYVVNKKNKVESRPIKIGKTYKKMQVITSGLTLGDVVIIDGTQKVRPGMKVIPQFGQKGKATQHD